MVFRSFTAKNFWIIEFDLELSIDCLNKINFCRVQNKGKQQVDCYGDKKY